MRCGGRRGRPAAGRWARVQDVQNSSPHGPYVGVAAVSAGARLTVRGSWMRRDRRSPRVSGGTRRPARNDWWTTRSGGSANVPACGRGPSSTAGTSSAATSRRTLGSSGWSTWMTVRRSSARGGRRCWRAASRVRDLMARMGHDNERAAMIYLHRTQGADRRIADALPVDLGDS